ncbi:MAG: quinone oxidoreductase [Roseiflexus sp.]|jgi:NADPH2:quinone reductase|nr:quinone oxidoreductase [Roseiflexus sp.]MBO9336880.1 quinone oxidoreductase [Roseiflexus sp.]MBO9365843.1 quinone oxidoreductase [Roseiflexus sp.]MBO9383821.1 quinone oxidoreductase [Roseiflexus sp.]MBO9390273.1 quinone oxidoreductase [Roseiflexus sp.]
MRAIRVHEYGGPEVLRLEDLPIPEPGPGEARVKIAAIGVNFIDIYHRSGQYKGVLPMTPGMEAAGVVDAVGPEVSDVRVGDRVVYAMRQGAYAEYAIVPATMLVPVPEGIDLHQAAAVMLQGMTAHYLTHSTYPLRQGEVTLIHAAAGGVGLLLVQIAKRRGARVIGTVSTEEKAALAREAGADDIILYTQEDFSEAVRRLTDGAGVHVVYDSVGKTTFEGSLNCLRPRGYMVLFGQSSGAVPPFDPQVLNAKGSLFLTRPSLGHYLLTRDELLWRAGDLFAWMTAGELKVRIDATYPLEQAAEAHRALASRATSGKLLLLP